jgi:hypothetical protein
MSELLEKCEVCGALIDEEDLFCANCGAEAPHDDLSPAAAASRVTTHNFTCSGCGASMSYDASAQALRCPFCGSKKMEQQQDAKTLSPSRVVPLAVDRERAIQIMRQYLGRGFWRPGDLAKMARVAHMAAVYVPYWVFQARTHTYWTADTNSTPPGARGDWYPLSGEHRSRYSGLLVGASGALTPHETWEICPFNLATAVPPERIDLDNATVETFAVQRKYARPVARQYLENMEAGAIDQQYIPGTSRNLKVNVRIEGMASEPVLLPVWIMSYRYRDRVFRFLVNGQSGKATGEAPTSTTKIAVAVLIGIACIVGLLVILWAMASG